MTEDHVRALRRAVAREVWLGAESGSQRVLDAMQKGITVEQTRAAVRRLRSEGVRVGLFLQFGYSGEGWGDVQATRALVRELLPDDIGVSVSYPLPGTAYHAKMEPLLRSKRNWTQSSDLDPLVVGPFSRGFYQSLSRVVHAELRVLRGARAVQRLLQAVRGPLTRRTARAARAGGPAADGEKRQTLRRATELRHAAAWMFHRVRLEAERRKSPGDSRGDGQR
jgi:anaerobic magnesium-protoporphyrin IX monomethyl ester cyclase